MDMNNTYQNPYDKTKNIIKKNATVVFYNKKGKLYLETNEISVITDHKLLVTICKKDTASLSHRLHRILIQVHQYSFRILYKTGQQLFIKDYLSRHKLETNRGGKNHVHA